MARAACRDPDPGPAGPALERIDQLLSSGEAALADGVDQARLALGLVMSAAIVAATEPFTAAG